MNSRLTLTPLFWIILWCTLLTTTLSRATNGPTSMLSDELGGENRFLAYVSTDKPIYREGETVYLRAVILDASDNTPVEDGNNNSIYVEITGPKGEVVHEGLSYGANSAIAYQWNVPAGLTGGEYSAKITSPSLGIPETTRVFDIRAFRSPRIKTQIEFTRDGYGPGDQVKASVVLERAEGGVPHNAAVTAVARVDGNEIYRIEELDISESGVVNAAFSLPDDIGVGEGSLSFLIEDGGVVETASKTLPIILQKLDITFYPESGELVAGLQSRIYFQARLTNGKPADVEGYIVEIKNNIPDTNPIAFFKSTHEGRGLFVMKPEKGKQYAAVFTAPSGIAHPEMLPLVRGSGTVLKSSRSAFLFDEGIEFFISSNADNSPARMTLYKRDVLLDNQEINSDTVTLDARDAEGVLIATAWDNSGQPLAERLIYRHPKFGLNIELNVSDEALVPGANVTVDILTTDKKGNPVEAVVGLTVTDDTVLELIEKRQQAPRLPAMVYLENEVLDLADAQVYLDSSNADAATDIDLLLGTQGWRRFVLVEYTNIKNRYARKIAQAMAEKKPSVSNIFMMQQRNGAMAEQMAIPLPLAAENVAFANVENDGMEQAKQAIRLEEIAVFADEIIENERLQPANIIAGRADEAELAISMADMAEPVNGGYVREFAFKARVNRQPNERIDFTETLYWNTGVKTDARNGRATVKFSLSDSVTTFRLMADGYGRNGALGTSDALIESVEPFYITTKMPSHAMTGDIIELPITLVNTSTDVIKNAGLRVSGQGITSSKMPPVKLAPGERRRSIVTLTTTMAGTFPITVTAQAGPYHDTMTRSLTVAPAGFPVAHDAGGLLSSTTPFVTNITIPDNITQGSLNASVKVYPSPLASMEEALNALLREPHGCFEQTSSTNYPLVMAQQYFDGHTGVDPAKISKAQGLLKTGYSKLISFETENHGYEWFGANPAHEALTAYGLMQFTDMAKVMQIDDTMIKRTRQWLLDRRDGEGGFKRNEMALDSFGGAPTPTTDAYIVWALLESGQSPLSLKPEIARIKTLAFNGNDSYIDALATNILSLSGDNTSAELLAEKLVNAADETGAIQGATTSITGSGGEALTIETTSLALLAWLRNDEQWAFQVEKSIKWLFERSKAGRFGSTQSTVLALKAINTYDAARSVPKQPGALRLFINGKPFEQPVTFTTESKGVIELPDFSRMLIPGQHQIEVRMIDGSKMPFALHIQYNTPLPNNEGFKPANLATTLSHAAIKEGEPLELKATVSAGESNVATPIAIIGIPAGLELRHEQLKELVAKGSISAYEVRHSELVIYWRAMKANESRVIPINLIAEIPGRYIGPASRIYPYYTDEQKHWEAGHLIEVVAQ